MMQKSNCDVCDCGDCALLLNNFLLFFCRRRRKSRQSWRGWSECEIYTSVNWKGSIMRIIPSKVFSFSDDPFLLDPYFYARVLHREMSTLCLESGLRRTKICSWSFCLYFSSNLISNPHLSIICLQSPNYRWNDSVNLRKQFHYDSMWRFSAYFQKCSSLYGLSHQWYCRLFMCSSV